MNTTLIMSLMVAMTFTIVYTLRYLMGREYGKAATVLVTWLGGFLVVFVVSRSELGAGFSLKELVGLDMTLDQVNGWTLLVVAFAIASAAVGFNEVKAAIDRSDSAVKPPLFPPSDS